MTWQPDVKGLKHKLNPGCLVGILVMVHCNPYITGWVNPFWVGWLVGWLVHKGLVGWFVGSGFFPLKKKGWRCCEFWTWHAVWIWQIWVVFVGERALGPAKILKKLLCPW